MAKTSLWTRIVIRGLVEIRAIYELWQKQSSRTRIVIVSGTIIILALGSWRLWIRSDQYQVGLVLDNSTSLLAGSRCQTIIEWNRVLTLSGRVERAATIGLSYNSSECKFAILTGLIRAFSIARDTRVINESEQTGLLIKMAAEESLKEALKFSDAAHRIEKLKEIVIICKRAGIDQVSRIATENVISQVSGISDAQQRYNELVRLSLEFASANLSELSRSPVEQAFALSIKTNSSGNLRKALGKLATDLTGAGMANIVLDEARKLTNPLLQCYILTSVASTLARNNERDEARRIANEAIGLLPYITEQPARSDAYTQVALAYIGEEDETYIDVYTALNLIPNVDNNKQSYIRYLAVWELRDAGDMKKAVEVANQITAPYFRAVSYSALVSNIYKEEQDKNTSEGIKAIIKGAGVVLADLAEKYIGRRSGEVVDGVINNGKKREEVARETRSALERMNDTPLSRQFYDLVCSHAESEPDSLRKYRIYKRLWDDVSSLPKYGSEAGDRALSAAMSIRDDLQRKTALIDVCRKLAKLGKFDQALAICFAEIDDLNLLGEITKQMADPRTAVSQLEKLYGNVTSKFRDPRRAVIAYIALGRAFSFAGHAGHAEAARGLALNVAGSLNDQPSLNHVADVMLEAKDFYKADKIAEWVRNAELADRIKKARTSSQISPPDATQKLIDRIINLTSMGEYREARLTAEALDTGDLRLIGYTEILRAYAKEQDPHLAKII